MCKSIYVLLIFVGLSASGSSDNSVSGVSPSQQTIITDCYATGYFCVLNNEVEGTQTLTKNMSNINFTLKASFLFGGWGVAMQGTGKTAPEGDYIKYAGGGGSFVRIAGPDAGKNLDGRWAISPDILRERYARLGITDFTGFGNLALPNPENATYIKVPSFAGSMGTPLTPWFSIAADSSLIPPGQTCSIIFKNGYDSTNGSGLITAKIEDVGSAVKGKHIDIYLGEGRTAIDQWNRSGGNRYVDVYISTD